MRKFLLILLTLGHLSTSYGQAPVSWTVNPSDFTFDMAITALVQINEQDLITANDKVAAFINGTVVGVGSPTVQVASTGKTLLFLSVYDNVPAGSVVSFKIFSSQSNSVTDALSTIVFENNGQVGASVSPFIISNNYLPTDISIDRQTISENLATNVVIGTFTTTDANDTDGFIYDLVDGTVANDNSSFSIIDNTLVTRARFNFELRSTYNVRVRTTDRQNAKFEKEFPITILDENDSPFLFAPSDTVSFKEDLLETLAIVTSTAKPVYITDEDSGNQIVTITSTLGTVSIGNIDNVRLIVGDGQLDSLLTFDGSFAAVNLALEGLSFLSNKDFNGTGGLIKVVITDGPYTRDKLINIRVLPTNDAPTLSAPSSVKIVEDTVNGFLASKSESIFVSDIDNDPITVDITAEFGKMNLPIRGGLSIRSGTGTNDATLSFSGSIQNVNAALASLLFTPQKDYLGKDAKIRITISDGVVSVSKVILLNEIENRNDAPVIKAPVSVTINEDVSQEFVKDGLFEISVSDLDPDEQTITLKAINGFITLKQSSGVSITSGTGINDSTLVFKGSIQAVNAVLNGIKFTPGKDYFGSAASLSVTTFDGTVSVAHLIPIIVRPVNDAPTLKFPLSVQMEEDTPKEFLSSFNEQIVADDVDGDSLILLLRSELGLLSIIDQSGVTFDIGNGNKNEFIRVKGSISGINKALASLIFYPNKDYNGSKALIEISVADAVVSIKNLISFFIIPVNDNTEITLSKRNIPEKSPEGTLIGLFGTINQTLPSSVTAYQLVDIANFPDNAFFRINGNQLVSASRFIFNTKSSYTIKVALGEIEGINEAIYTFTVTVDNVNDKPSIGNFEFDVDEDSENGFVIGTVTATDEDVNTIFNFSLRNIFPTVGSNPISINNLTGAIQVVNSVDLDYERETIYEYLVIASDGITSDTGNLVVNVQDVLEMELPANNIVTPNGDGFNDSFEINNPQLYAGYTLKIFTSYGSEVYSTSNYNNNWSGNGLPVGTYFYKFFGPANSYKYSGSITLLRD